MSENMEQAKNIKHILDSVKKTKHETATHGAARFTIPTKLWCKIGENLGKGLDLLSLWADHKQVHMAIYDVATQEFLIVSNTIKAEKFPSIGQYHAPAIRAERIIKDLYGIKAFGLPDDRQWLDHGNWPISKPLAKKPTPTMDCPEYKFLGAEGESLHQMAVGPVHAGIIEPGHFRFFLSGETVVRLELRQGYTHKGIEKLLEGKTPIDAAPICARVSGDSTVAYSLAFARATETALQVEIPERAHWLRALMAELERLANHFGDIGAICNDAGFAFINAHFGIMREDVLQAAKLCFGHRLMMDCVVPGGVDRDLDTHGYDILETLLEGLRDRLPRLVEIFDDTPSLQDRARNTGYLNPAFAQTFAAGGFVGRASGRNFDARRDLNYKPYDMLTFETPVLHNGDVSARVWLRIHEVEQSLSICEQILRMMPHGDIKTNLPDNKGTPTEGVAVVEGFRGDIFVWVKLDGHGKIERCYPRDPSQFQWPLIEAIIENNIVADFPLCNKSFNCSYSGHDL
jgi:Ni,Fe-hydrogenase III large subunit/Ni,Fe-hydrogenase III component G